MGRWIAAVALALACNTPDPLPELSATIDGRVWFQGAAPGVTVHLHERTIDGELLGAVAETQTDEAGRFVLQGLRDTGPFAIRVELADPLLAPVDEIQPFSPDPAKREVFVAVSPWTTLLMATAEARRQAGEARPLFSATQDFQEWLGFDVRNTDFESEGSLRLSVQHALLTEAFDRLAERIAADVGVRPGTLIDPPALLRALRADAAGDPPGVFDGHGPEGLVRLRGVGDYALSAHTLQNDLLAALDALVEDPESGWDLNLADLRPLRERLACAGTGLFPECTGAVLDETPPTLVDIKPEPDNTEPFSGVIDVWVRFADPEGQVVEITLERLRDARGGVVEAYPGEDGQFLVDTTSVIGNGSLHLRARARNDSGLWSAPVQFQYAIRNVGEGILGGQVYKGAATGVTVVAFGARDGVETELARATTDMEGRFGLRLTEYQGDVRLLAEAAGEAAFFDEARGTAVRWPQDGTLSALVLDYDPRNGEQSATVSPFTDLALILAEVWARRGDGPLDDQYADALRRIAGHLGMQAVETLVSGVPAPLEPVSGVEDPERFLLALACIAEQARGLAVEVFPQAPDNFNALDLVALYRVDAEDGRLDGLKDNAAVAMEVDGQPVTLPVDAFRNDLATSCARWLGGANNPTGVEPGEVVHLLEQMATREDARLFGEALDPRPFDDQGPEVAVRVAGETLVGPPWVGAGVFRFEVAAQDEAGVARIELTLLDGVNAHLERVNAEPTDEVLRQRVATGMVEADALPERFEETPLRLRVLAVDLLDHETVETVEVRVDRTPPALTVEPVGVGVLGDTWHTNFQGMPGLVLVAEDATPIAVTMTLGGEALEFQAEAAREVEIEMSLPRRDAGDHPLVACATDVLGRETCVERTVVADFVAPTANRVETAYFDEREAVTVMSGGPTLNLLPADAVTWGADDAVVHVHKTQLTLGAGDSNLPRLQWRVEDDRTPVDELRLVYQGEALETDWRAPEQPMLPLHQGVLGVDPNAPPLDDVAWRATLTLTDLAGNVTEVPTPEVRLHIIAPPPLIEHLQTSDGAVDPATMRLGSDAIHRALDGAPIEFARVQISNPWDVPIYIRAPQPDVVFEAYAPDRPEAIEHFVPAQGEGYDRVVVPECMTTRDAFGNMVARRDRIVEAVSSVEGRIRQLRPFQGAECRFREDPNPTRPARQVPSGRGLRNWSAAPGEAQPFAFQVEAPARGESPESLGFLLRQRIPGRDHAVLIDQHPFSRSLLFHVVAPGCLPEGDPWGCREGWWLTRRSRRVDTLSIRHPDWRLEWLPGGDEQCDECARAGRALSGGGTRVLR